MNLMESADALPVTEAGFRLWRHKTWPKNYDLIKDWATNILNEKNLVNQSIKKLSFPPILAR